MTYTVSPRQLRAKLSTVQDRRNAEARMAKWDLEARPMDVADEVVKRAIRSVGGRPGGYTIAKGTLTYVNWGITISKDGSINWGGFTFQQAAE